MTGTTVRISDSAHETLKSLARQAGRSMQAVLDEAVEAYRRARFWGEVDAAARALKDDQAAWNQELAERRLWEATLGDGIEPL